MHALILTLLSFVFTIFYLLYKLTKFVLRLFFRFLKNVLEEMYSLVIKFAGRLAFAVFIALVLLTALN